VLGRNAVERALAGGIAEAGFDCCNVGDAHFAEDAVLWTNGLVEDAKEGTLGRRK
jgi:hypothetical protein